jgi:hypothetical protein
VIFTLGNLLPKPGASPVPDPLPSPGPSASAHFVLDQNENAFEITFDPDVRPFVEADVTGFADARDVYNISIQSVDHQS